MDLTLFTLIKPVQSAEVCWLSFNMSLISALMALWLLPCFIKLLPAWHSHHCCYIRQTWEKSWIEKHDGIQIITQSRKTARSYWHSCDKEEEGEADAFMAILCKPQIPNQQIRPGHCVDMTARNKTLIAWLLGRWWGSLRPGCDGGTGSYALNRRRGWWWERGRIEPLPVKSTSAMSRSQKDIYDAQLSRANEGPIYKSTLKDFHQSGSQRMTKHSKARFTPQLSLASFYCTRASLWIGALAKWQRCYINVMWISPRRPSVRQQDTTYRIHKYSTSVENTKPSTGRQEQNRNLVNSNTDHTCASCLSAMTRLESFKLSVMLAWGVTWSFVIDNWVFIQNLLSWEAVCSLFPKPQPTKSNGWDHSHVSLFQRLRGGTPRIHHFITPVQAATGQCVALDT